MTSFFRYPGGKSKMLEVITPSLLSLIDQELLFNKDDRAIEQ